MGRGKGHFDNGFKGGVHLTKDPSKVAELCTAMIGHKLITKQTPPGGVPVSKVMVAEAIDITRETYFCILMDRESNGPVIIASPDGGVDIKAGVSDAMATELAEFLGFKGELVAKCADQIQRWRTPRSPTPGRWRPPSTLSTTSSWTGTSAASSTEPGWPWPPWTSSSCTGESRPTSWMWAAVCRNIRSRRPSASSPRTTR